MNRDLPSIDMVRLIRRSMRCFIFGLLGIVPLFGAGFAWQALRLQGAITRELEEAWTLPPVYCYWLLGVVGLAGADRWGGGAADLAFCFVLLIVQSWHIWRSFVSRRESVWNPGGPQLLWGTVLANAGVSLSVWVVVILVLRAAEMASAV